jgi:hypothetical protein
MRSATGGAGAGPDPNSRRPPERARSAVARGRVIVANLREHVYTISENTRPAQVQRAEVMVGAAADVR